MTAYWTHRVIAGPSEIATATAHVIASHVLNPSVRLPVKRTVLNLPPLDVESPCREPPRDQPVWRFDALDGEREMMFEPVTVGDPPTIPRQTDVDQPTIQNKTLHNYLLSVEV